jgi:hypothetical protein
MVEGVLHLLRNVRQDSLQVFHDIARPNAENAKAPLIQITVASGVSERPLAEIVRRAIHFDDEIGARYEEVSNIRADRMLPTHFEAEFRGA